MKTNKKLDELFETIRLIDYFATNEVFSRKHFEESFKEENSFGKGKKEILDRWFPIMEKYVGTFQKYLDIWKDDRFFWEKGKNENESILEVCTSILLINRDWVTDIEALPEKEIYEGICENLFQSIPDRLESAMELLQSQKFSPAACWKLLMILKEPKIYFERLTHLIRRHLPAQAKAWKQVEGQLKNQVESFEVHPEIFESIPTLIDHAQDAFPSLIVFNSYTFPGGATVVNCYGGIMANELMDLSEDTKKPKENLTSSLKLMGDPNKFEILHFMKETPRYNIEIAEHLKVTAATASHHMNNLLSGNLVTVDKREGRVYYSLRKEKIQETILNMEEILLK